jgi:hypothetical protein
MQLRGRMGSPSGYGHTGCFGIWGRHQRTVYACGSVGVWGRHLGTAMQVVLAFGVARRLGSPPVCMRLRGRMGSPSGNGHAGFLAYGVASANQKGTGQVQVSVSNLQKLEI